MILKRKRVVMSGDSDFCNIGACNIIYRQGACFHDCATYCRYIRHSSDVRSERWILPEGSSAEGVTRDKQQPGGFLSNSAVFIHAIKPPRLDELLIHLLNVFICVEVV